MPDNTSPWLNSVQRTRTPSTFPIPLLPQTSSQQSSTCMQGATSNISRRTNHEEKVIAHLEKRTAERNEIIKNLRLAEHNLDEINLFFQSIARSVMKLLPHLQHCAEVKILTMIGELEVEMLNSFHPAHLLYHPSSSPVSSSISASGSSKNSPHAPLYAYSASTHYSHSLSM